MQLTAIPDDDLVFVDGVPRTVPIGDIVAAMAAEIDAVDPPDIHAIQWGGARGWIEFKGRRGNLLLLSDMALIALRDAWIAAEVIPTLDDQKIAKREQVRAEALRRARIAAPEIEDMQTLRIVRAIWPAIANAAPAGFAKAKAMLDFAEGDAATEINKRRSKGTIAEIDPTKAKPFGATGPAWPKA
jgi:hypothetical protein